MENFVLDAAKELENATKINTKNSTEKARVKTDDVIKLPVGKNSTIIINGTSTEGAHLNSTVKPSVTVTTLKPKGDDKNSTSTKPPFSNGTLVANSVRIHYNYKTSTYRQK